MTLLARAKIKYEFLQVTMPDDSGQGDVKTPRKEDYLDMGNAKDN